MDSTLVNILISAGVAGVFCVLFIIGMIVPKSVITDLKAENRELKGEVEAQRDRADTAIAAAQAARDVMAALQAGIQMARDQRDQDLPAQAPSEHPELRDPR
jgi:hypothetical protein